MRTFRTPAFAAALLMIFAGCKATPPGRFETSVMNTVKRTVLVRNKSEQNPLRDHSGALAGGREAFSHYCAACHGLDGRNSGVPFADHMSPPVPKLSSSQVQAYTDGQLKWVIDYGLWPSGMPGSKGPLSDDEIWSIVVYLRHLPPSGSLGDPETYSH